MTDFLLDTYARFPILASRGKGAILWDEQGKEYLDFLSGIAVTNLGHCHEKLIKIVTEQAKTLWHVSNFFHLKKQEELAEKLVSSAFPGKVFLGNSGAEANEGALKLARKHTREHFSPTKTKTVSFSGSFHGRTFWALSVTGKDRFGEKFSPLVGGHKVLPYNSIQDLEKINTDVSSVIVELIQGERGVYPANAEWISSLRKRCDEVGAVLIFDEVQTGIGRTGTMWAFEHFNIQPDILTFAKALGNGFPIGGFLASKNIEASFGPGDHGSTFGGNPLATSVGVGVFDDIMRPGFLKEVQEKSKYIFESLLKLSKNRPELDLEIRGKGLMIGITGLFEAKKMVQSGFQEGFILNAPSANTLRLLPPLIIEKKQIDSLIDFFKNSF
jgi:acetylornithine/N-succinyldiaminopimelate aminotransferase